MSSIFPSLLFLSFFAPFILRLAAGALSLRQLFKENNRIPLQKRTPEERAWLLAEFFATLLVLIGLFTQLAAIVLILLYARKIFKSDRRLETNSDSAPYFLLLMAIFFSLILTGPGIFAFDLPL